MWALVAAQTVYIVAVGGGYLPLPAAHGFLTVVASCCGDAGFRQGFGSCGTWAQWLWVTAPRSRGSAAVAHRAGQLFSTGPFWIRGWTHVFCTGRWTLPPGKLAGFLSFSWRLRFWVSLLPGLSGHEVVATSRRCTGFPLQRLPLWRSTGSGSRAGKALRAVAADTAQLRLGESSWPGIEPVSPYYKDSILHHQGSSVFTWTVSGGGVLCTA